MLKPKGMRLPIDVILVGIRWYLCRTSGYSCPQITRVVARWDENGLATGPPSKRYLAPVAPFVCKYTATNIEPLVQMDRANVDECGPVVVHLLQRACRVYADPHYVRLADLSPSHLDNRQAECALTASIKAI